MVQHSAIDHTGITGVGVADAISETLIDAKGDLIAGSAADTAAKLTAGSNDTILMADSGQTTGLKWVASQTPSTQAFGDSAAEGTADTYARGDHKHAMPASPAGALLAVARYAPASQTIYTCGSSTLADVDATNMKVTFTAPATGNIIVVLSAFADISNGAEFYWGLRESTSDISGSVYRMMRTLNDDAYLSARIYLTGVSAGSHTYKWSFALGSGTSGRIIIQDGSATTKWAPALLEVWAAP